MIQSPSGSSAVRSRRAASAAGRIDVEVRAADLAVADPLHVPAVGVEGHRPAHAVHQRLRVAVVVVGAGHAVVVVGHPRDRRVVRAKRRAREQQPEARPRERLDGRAPPRRVLAHVVRLVGDQQRRALGAAPPVHRRPRGHRRVGHRDAVAIAWLGPLGVRPVGLQVDAVARGVQRPLAADVGGRRDDRHARHAPLGEHPVGDVQPEGGLAGGGRRGREERVAGMVENGSGSGLLPGTQGSGGGPGGQGAAHRGSIDLERHGRRHASRRTGRNGRPEAWPCIFALCGGRVACRETFSRNHFSNLSQRVHRRNPLLRPRLPVGLVGLSCHRRAQMALRRPTQLARRDDRPHRDRLRLRGARLHARRPGARVPQLPLARDAVRDRTARARPRHVADVPRRRRHPPPVPRARVRRLPRAAVRAVHDDALPRGRRGPPRGDRVGARHRRRHDHRRGARRRRPRRVFEQDTDEARTAEGGPTEFQGKSANTDGRVRFTAPSIKFSNGTPDARGRRLPDLRGLRRDDRQPRHEPHPPRARRRTPPRSSPRSRTA